MPYIPPSVVREVKRMDLLTYLKNYEPYELVHFSGNTYTTRTHDSLKISNGKWMWWSQRTGGRSALDYLIKVRGYSFLEAVELLAERANIQPPLSVSENVPIEKQLLLVWIWKPGRVVCLLCVMVLRTGGFIRAALCGLSVAGRSVVYLSRTMGREGL